MIPYIEDCYFWKRENNILIACKYDATEIPLVKFTYSNFIDVAILNIEAIRYMEQYVAMFPHHCEILFPPKIEESTDQQLTLF